MLREADYYTPGEAAKALGIPPIRVFAMLCSGELEGRQDERARWRVPVGVVERARQRLEVPSGPSDPSEHDDAEGRAADGEARSEGILPPLQELPSGADMAGSEDTSHEQREASVPASPPTSRINAAGAEGDDHYTVDEAAQILELSPACIRQMLRAGELEGKRREERIEGVLGPWRIPQRAVHALKEGDPGVLRAKRRNAGEADMTTTAQLPPEEATGEPLLEEASLEEASAETPSEASELLSESVREVREKAEALRQELGILEGRLERMEITESALREGLQREKERADRERERADELRAELERARVPRREEPQEFWRRLFRP
jgi:Helix-turn-helix domain